jgi:uncharacterized protein YndB with AHSA1/START domain
MRRSLGDVFDAFVNPKTILDFWLDSTTGPLAKGAVVLWEFMIPGSKETVEVTDFIENERIAFNWSDGTHVELEFAEHARDQTTVSVKISEFDESELFEQAINATAGFSIDLCDLKTLLEAGRSANLVRDKAELIAASM